MSEQQQTTPASGDKQPDNAKAQPVKANATAPTSQVASAKSSSGNGLLWFVCILTLLLVIALAGAGYYLFYQRANTTQALEKTQLSLTARLDQALASTNQTNNEIESLKESKQLLQSNVAELESQLQALTQTYEALKTSVQNQQGQRPSDWLIAEADYLVKMAGRKLWLEQDLRTAIMLLVNADKRLKSLGDPSLLPVRAVIAADIQALQQLDPASQTSVALAISGMLPQLDSLPLNAFEKPKSTEQKQALSEDIADWKANLQRVWRNLVDSFFTVKTVSEPIAPVLTESQRFIIREQAKLQLMQAQSAALDGQQTLFEQALTNATQILLKRYDATDTRVTALADALNNLYNTQVSRPLPTQLNSVQAIEDVLEQRVKQAFNQGATPI